MLFNTDPSFIAQLTKHEMLEFKKSSTIDVEVAKNPFVDANVLYQVNSTSNALKDLLETSWHTQQKDVHHFPANVSKYFKAVTESIIKVPGQFSYREAIALLAETSALMGTTFAGAILIQGKKLINPFHPLTALAILDQSDYLDGARYKIVVYKYPNRANLDSYYSSKSADPEKVAKNINDLILTYTRRTLERKVKVDRSEMDGDTIYQKYRVSKEEGENLDKEFFVSTHQVLTHGIVAPYYGTSIITMNGSTYGHHCTPFHSVNISQADRTVDMSVRSASVCTGNSSNETLDGLRTLTHANLSSPYSRDVLEPGALIYADACISKSLEIYSLAKVI